MDIQTLKLTLKDFRGIKEGSLEFKRVNIVMGGNNSGKTTVLESLFLAPNPLRYVPYGVDKSAVGVLNDIHSTLGSSASISLLHGYTSDLASITISHELGTVSTEFRVQGDRIGISIRGGERSYSVGYLYKSSNHEDAFPFIGEIGKSPRTFYSEVVGNSLYFHPCLMKHAWEYFQYRWVDYRASGLTAKVAKEVSEGVAGEYDDLLLEPFIGGAYALYVRDKQGRGIRLGDLGTGAQVFATLLLLYESSRPRMLLIDDIESHMNPSLLMRITSWFMEILRDTMLFVSTHSLEVAKLVAGALDDYKPQIKLLDLHEGVLKVHDFSLEDVEELEKAGVDVRMGKGVLI